MSWYILCKNNMKANIQQIHPSLNCTCSQGQCSSQACLCWSCTVHCTTYLLPWMMLKGWKRHTQLLYRSVLQCKLRFTRWEWPKRFFSSQWMCLSWPGKVTEVILFSSTHVRMQETFSSNSLLKMARSHPIPQGIWMSLDNGNEACPD